MIFNMDHIIELFSWLEIVAKINVSKHWSLIGVPFSIYISMLDITISYRLAHVWNILEPKSNPQVLWQEAWTCCFVISNSKLWLMQWWTTYLWKWHQHQNLVVETLDSIKVCSNCFVLFHLETRHECWIIWNNLLYLKDPLRYYKHNESCTK